MLIDIDRTVNDRCSLLIEAIQDLRRSLGVDKDLEYSQDFKANLNQGNIGYCLGRLADYVTLVSGDIDPSLYPHNYQDLINGFNKLETAIKSIKTTDQA